MHYSEKNSKELATDLFKTTGDREALKIPFKVENNHGLIHRLCNFGFVVKVDETCSYACACFDNLKDFWVFNDILKCSLRQQTV